MLNMHLPLLLLCIFAVETLAATAQQWKGRVIYQILTDRFATSDGASPQCNTAEKKYCGGTWKGIINNLDYIQGLGISAIWISPVVQNIPAGNTVIGDPYHGYWQNDINTINPYFGTSDDLRDLSDALHARSMYLMIDVITNHLAYPGPPDAVDYSTLKPFNESFYYHPFCQITQEDYSNPNQDALETLKKCWLGDNNNELVDLNTTRQDVVDTWNSWVVKLISDYQVDGLRVDTVKHVDKSFWANFCTTAGVYCLGEVADGDLDYVCPYQEVMDGVVNYPLYYVALRALQQPSGNMTALRNNINGIKFACKDSNLLGPFSENHDLPRNPSITDDRARSKNMIAFGLMSDGIPIIYAGQEQYYSGGADPANREAVWLSAYDTESEFYQFTRSVINLRNHAGDLSSGYNSYSQIPIYNDDHTIALLKGDDGVQVISVFSNYGSNGGTSSISLTDTRFNPGDSVIEIVECTQTVVDDEGLNITNTGEVQIWYAEANLVGSGICGK